MVRPRCIVSYCKNQGRHKFPKDEARRSLWIQAIKHIKPNYTINLYSGVCGDHFRLDDFSVIPSYWNNYHPARILKKSAVPSVFDWNKTFEEEIYNEEPSSIDDTLIFDSNLLMVEVEEPTSAQETVSFNPERVRATYSKGQSSKDSQSNPSLQKANRPQNASSYSRLKTNKRPSDDNDEFLTAITNNGEKRLKISSKPPNNSQIVGQVFVTKTKPPIGKAQVTSQGKLHDYLPTKVTTETDTQATDIWASENSMFNSEGPIGNIWASEDDMFTSCLPLEVNIKTEEEVETSQDENRLATPSLPSEVTKTDSPDIMASKDESTSLPLEANIKIKQEIVTPIESEDVNSLVTPSLPTEVTIKIEPEEEKCSTIKDEYEILEEIKQENEGTVDINL